eukprot:TRINITY_DN23350_c0_g1_i1.p1 TRINITY_DN23350_c0_g1~~TRINITY_DN23350_c0_g1_i1.p1  ORF type:complete len:270 (+),score=59.77 TRINITY_DN23350_c0_g1_i1:104-913(+)
MWGDAARPGARLDEHGHIVVPGGVRADGSRRKEVRVRRGYTQQDEVPAYTPPHRKRGPGMSAAHTDEGEREDAGVPGARGDSSRSCETNLTRRPSAECVRAGTGVDDAAVPGGVRESAGADGESTETRGRKEKRVRGRGAVHAPKAVAGVREGRKGGKDAARVEGTEKTASAPVLGGERREKSGCSTSDVAGGGGKRVATGCDQARAATGRADKMAAEKRAKKVCKLLKQVAELEKRSANGDTLDADQHAKIGRRRVLEEELASLRGHG